MRYRHYSLDLSTAAAAGFMAPAPIAAAAVPVEGDGQQVSWVQLLKTGEFRHGKHGAFTVDVDLLQALAANFDRFPQGVPGDYDHSFLTTGDTRAAGWVRRVEVRGAELWGEIAWTASAADAIRNGEYRFLSPEFTFDWTDERGESRGPALLAFGLTNRPFLEGMREVSLAASPGGDRILLMNPRLQADDTDEGAATVDRDELIKAMGLAADATDEQIVAAARARQGLPDGAVVLSADEHKDLTARAEAGDEAARKAAEQVKELHLSTWQSTGKLAPADRDMVALAYDADPDKVIAAMTERKANPAFTAAGGDGTDTDDGDDGDKTYAQRLDERAKALASERDVSYAEGLRIAAQEIPRDHPALGRR